MSPVTPPTIFLNDISLAFAQQILFEHLNWQIASGQWTCLLGSSGVGKSTLLRLIAGIENFQDTIITGDVSTDNNVPLISQVAYMAQTDLLLPWLTAFENALLGYRLRHDVNHIVKEKAHELFARMQLTDAKDKHPNQLSGGMRQRVALIRTLLEEKPIVLMDEPFSALDAITRLQLQDLAADWLTGKTVLLVTHDPFEALRLGHQVYILMGKPAQMSQPIIPSQPAPRSITDPEILKLQAEILAQLTYGVTR